MNRRRASAILPQAYGCNCYSLSALRQLSRALLLM